MKEEKVVKFRHKFTRKVIFPLIGIYVKLKSNIKIEKFKEVGKGPYLVLFNHQTGYDQFLVGLSFKFPLFYLASDDLLVNGIYSKIINYFAGIIPIKKNVTDVSAVKKCIKIAKEGGTIAIAPEGNRTYSGETCSFNPAIASLIKTLNLPIVIYKIEGGYNVVSRWKDKPNKGKARAFVKRVIQKEEYENLTKSELCDKLATELYNNDYNINENYKGRRKAEYLERVAYVCPTCGLSEFKSIKNTIYCKKCKLAVEYLDDKSLKCTNAQFSFKNYLEWYNYQNQFINKLNLLDGSKLFYNDQVKVYKVIPLKRKILLQKNANLSLFNNKVEILLKDGLMSMSFNEVDGVSVLGRNKLNIYFNGNVYQIKGDKRFNGVKYLNFYHRYNNQLKGVENEFLGL